MAANRIDRRALVRALAYGLGAISLGRIVGACSDAVAPSPYERDDPNASKKGDAQPDPTDQDEHVPGKSTPVDTGENAPKIPVPSWEARVKQLEAEQSRQYGRETFSRASPGIWAGKENSHEPKPSVIQENGRSRVEVTVEHVMGANKLDAGVAVIMDAAVEAGRADGGKDAGTSDAGAKDAGVKVDAGASDAATPPIHYITTIYLRALVNGVDQVVGLWEFASTDAAPPTVRFTLPPDVTEVTAYEWCTLHGLWKAPPLRIT